MTPFLYGLGLGIGVAVLYAPRSGRDTREQLVGYGRRATSRIQPLVNRTREQVRPMLDQARESVAPVLDQVRNASSAVTENVRMPAILGGSSLLTIVNEWPEQRLLEIDGIGPVLASKIISNRPYESEDAFIRAKLVPPSAVEKLRSAS